MGLDEELPPATCCGPGGDVTQRDKRAAHWVTQSRVVFRHPADVDSAFGKGPIWAQRFTGGDGSSSWNVCADEEGHPRACSEDPSSDGVGQLLTWHDALTHDHLIAL